MNWYIGQEIVAVRDNPNHSFKKGEIYKIHALQHPECGCSHVEINIGVINEKGWVNCPVCKKEYYENYAATFYHERNFAPLQTDSEKADMEESLTEIFARELFT